MEKEYDMNQLLEEQEIVDTICPICGKNFIPAPFHAFKTYGGVRVCSWSCQIRAERENFRPKPECHPTKPILMFHKDGTYIEEYPSAIRAGASLGISHEAIRKCCRGQTKSAGGFVFRYKPTDSGEKNDDL